MEKLILVLILTCVSTSAMAEWTKVVTTDSSMSYADKNKIHKRGNIAKMWVLTDYSNEKTFNGKIFRSAINLTEYDCNDERSRVLSSNVYSENMGAGTVVLSDDNSDKWRAVVPNSQAEFLWNFACKKK